MLHSTRLRHSRTKGCFCAPSLGVLARLPPLRCHAVHHPVYWWAVVPLTACNIVKRMTQARIRRQDSAESTGPVALFDPADVSFAHPSEAEFARILDFYRITWQYEPHTFTLRWHDDGSPAERFTPDFYLPELDLYVELTTLKQSLVTRKKPQDAPAQGVVSRRQDQAPLWPRLPQPAVQVRSESAGNGGGRHTAA